MRKIIETVSTLALWALWIIGSCLAVSDFFFKAEVSKKILLHLSLVAWAPLIAIGIFSFMLLAVRSSKAEATKKMISNEHAVQWSFEDLINAQKGKVVDLHFVGTGLACHVVTREEAALVLHSENQIVHLKVAAQMPEESVMALIPRAF